jgi:hypothetical protein
LFGLGDGLPTASSVGAFGSIARIAMRPRYTRVEPRKERPERP